MLTRILSPAALVLFTGCAGVYAEATASQLTTTLSPSGGGTSMDTGGATVVGFNLGVELGSVRQRFAMGYARQSVSLDAGSTSLGASEMRYDFNVVNLADRLKLRLGLGFDFGSGSSTIGGMSSDGSGGAAFGGIGATYFLTWSNALHILGGYQLLSQKVNGGSLAGTGPTARVTIAHTFGDVRPDKSFVIPLEGSRDITPIIESGASSLGCVTTRRSRVSFAARLEVACKGGRHVEYFQIAQGMMITCRREQSLASCKKLSEQIVEAAANGLSRPTTAPTATTAPAAPAPVPAAATPAAAPAPAPATPAPAAAPAPSNTGDAAVPTPSVVPADPAQP